ncbi:MAG: hypothetical protein R3B96_23955 [Pirellulaceae bacterium]
MDNDIAIQLLLENGSAGNGYHFQLVDDALLTSGPGVDAGNETVSFSPAAHDPPKPPLRSQARTTTSCSPPRRRAPTLITSPSNWSTVSAIGNTATATYDASAGRLTPVVDGSAGTQIQTLLNAINAEDFLRRV